MTDDKDLSQPDDERPGQQPEQPKGGDATRLSSRPPAFPEAPPAGDPGATRVSSIPPGAAPGGQGPPTPDPDWFTGPIPPAPAAAPPPGTEQVPAGVPTEEVPPAQPPPKRRRTGRVLLGILVGMALLGAAFMLGRVTAPKGEVVRVIARGSPSTVASPTPSLQSPTPSPSSSPGGAPHKPVQVNEKDFAITIEPVKSAPGRVKFKITNNGPGEHDFVLLKTTLALDQLPLAGAIVDLGGSGLQKISERDGIKADGKVTIKVMLGPGKYVVISNHPGDYQKGMFVAFTVAA